MWQLWHGLQRPSTIHPLFRWARSRPNAPFNLRLLAIRAPRAGWARTALSVLAILLGILLIFPALMLFIYFIFVLAPLAVPLANNVYCALYAAGASSMLTEEREHKRYEVLAVCPIGAIGIHWSVCAAWLQNSRTYGWLRNATLYFTAAGAAVGLLMFILFLLTRNYSTVVTALIIAAPASFYLDHMQSVVGATLTAMLIPVYAENRPNAQVWAVGVFAALQLAAYGLAAVGTAAVNMLYVWWGAPDLLASFSLPFVYTGFLYAIRERLIALMWQQVERLLNAKTQELDELTLTTTWQFHRLRHAETAGQKT